MHFIALTLHWYFKPGSSSPRNSRLGEVTRHFLLLGCCPCNQVGKTKAFQREKTMNFNLVLIKVEKYMEKFPSSDLPRCTIVFSFGITLRFYSAYCTLGVSHGTVQLLPAIHPYTTSTLGHSMLLLDRCLLPAHSPFGGQHLNIIIFWYLAWHSQLPDSWGQTYPPLVPALFCATKPETQCIINGQKPLIMARRAHYTSHKILWLYFWGQRTGSPLPFPVSDAWPL